MKRAIWPLTLLAFLGTGTASAAAAGIEPIVLTASDGQAGQRFGVSVAVDGNLAVVGATSALGAGGAATGAAYLFDATTGQELGKLTAPDGQAGDGFGWAVAIRGDTIVVGAPRDDDNGSAAGSAYVFDAPTRTFVAKLLAEDGVAGDAFGDAVDVDGPFVVVGAYSASFQNTGAAYVFDAATGQQIVRLLPADGALESWFGETVAVRGGTALVGARLDNENGFAAGAAYVFDAATGAQQHKLVPSDITEADFFGRIALDGTTAAIGAWRDDDNGDSSGSVYLFDVVTGMELAKLVPGDGAALDWFGWYVGIDGARVVVGAPYADNGGSAPGAAYVFDTASGLQVAELAPSSAGADEQVGWTVAASGDTVLVGSITDNSGLLGRAYLYPGQGLIGTQFCDGSDGALAACPCANPGGSDSGCDVQQATGGVELVVLEQESAPMNRATLAGNGYPAGATPASLLLRAASLEPAPVVFGDGLRCTAGPLVRASAAFAIGGTSTHAIGHVAPAGTYHYQLWFRSAPATFCDAASAFNLSNGRTLDW